MDFYLIPQVTASGFGNKRSYDSASVALMPSRIGKDAVVSKTKDGRVHHFHHSTILVLIVL